MTSVITGSLVWFLERLMVVAILFYGVFALLVVRQVGLLVSSIRTNLSSWVVALSFLHLVISLLCFIAALSLVF